MTKLSIIPAKKCGEAAPPRPAAPADYAPACL